MKISCNIIKDLLPLYKDNVCSEDSKKIIEEHLNSCNNCKSELDIIKNDLICCIESNLNEAESVKKIADKWKKSKIFSLIKGAFFTLLIVMVILLILFLNVEIVPNK